MRFGKQSVEICGELRKYKRISKGQLIDHQKQVEHILDDSKPLLKQADDLLKEYQEKISELADIEEMIEVIKSKKNTSDKEYDKVLDLISERKTLRKEISEFDKQMKEFTTNNENEMNRIMDEEVPSKLAELASKMVDISKEEFLENYTEDDELMIKHLSYFKQMSDAGKPVSDMQKLWEDIVDSTRNKKLKLSPSE